MASASRSKPPTLTDVAQAAGVSVPTASRVLNGGVRGVESGSDQLRKRVKEAARTLGYSVSTAAQTTKDGRARSVALIVSEIDDYGSATVISGMIHAAEVRGMSVAVKATRDDASRELDLLRQFRGERHRAVVVATSRTVNPSHEAAVQEELRILEQHGTRVVIIGDNGFKLPTVTVGNALAAAQLADGLVRQGRRRFAIISGPVDQVTSRDRVEGFVSGLRAHGVEVPESWIVHSEFSRDGGLRATRSLGDIVKQVDVIAAMSDTMAVGAIAFLRRAGMRVPEDVDVSGFDHVPLLGDLLPEFSTVEVPLARFGEAALILALEGQSDSRIVKLSATTIVRGKTYFPAAVAGG